MIFIEVLQAGGWAMAPILLCSVVTLTVFLERLFALRAARMSDTTWVQPMLEQLRRGQLGPARETAAAHRHPGGRVADATLRQLERRPDRAEAEARRVGSLELRRLENRLPVLAFVAQAAPLLGLLGTVFGMVDLFFGLEGDGLRDVDVERLSAGIWKALITTAAGLLVALPALAAHAWLASWSDHLRLQLSDIVERLLNETPPSA